HDGVAGLGAGEQMADRADAADAGRDGGHLIVRPALGETLEAAHLGDVELRRIDLARVIQVDGDFGVALDAGDVRNDDALRHGFPLYPNLTLSSRSILRPSSSSVST